MNVPDDLELTDAQGNARKNGEERRAINFLLECERGRRLVAEAKRNGAVEGDASGPFEAPPRMTIQSSVPSWSAASRQAEEEDIAPGTIWEKFGPDSPFVMVKEAHGWSHGRREAAPVKRMVAEDEERDSPDNP